jgi:HD-GYP domain-containing protein (c-di-GMP phosphodiesterase class II)
MAFARHVWDRDDDRVWHAGVAALLHDLGERQVSPQSLAGQDWRSEAKEEYRRHPQLALDCLPIAHLPGEIVSGILQHHESYDGTGFPDRRRGPQICLTARMLAIGDTFDRVISPSPDSPAILPPHEAVRLMESVLPGKFDPKLLTVFVKAL